MTNKIIKYLAALIVIIIASLAVGCSSDSNGTDANKGSQNLPAAVQDVPMVLIPAGSFEMGSSDGEDHEKPVHTVSLDEYYIDQYEVSNAQYSACVQARICNLPRKSGSETRTDYFSVPEYADYPVIYVTWDDANTFCKWRGGRLPTEAEWEKAAKGEENLMYPWGDSFEPNNLNYCDKGCKLPWASNTHSDGYVDTSPVGAYEKGASPYNVYDMSGNVWEWVADWYDPTYYQNAPSQNPLGPTTGEQRVTKGGGWVNDLSYLRTATRRRFSPDVPSSSVGFRCAKTP